VEAAVSFWQFLNHWWNLPSLVMLGLVGAWFGLQTLGLVEGAGSHEVEGDADAELGAEAEHELEHEQEVEHDHEQEHDSEGGGSPSPMGLAGFLGLGRVPFMVVWLTLFIFTGFTGLLINRFLFLVSGGGYRSWYFPLSLATSLLVGVFATRAASRLVWRLVDVGGRGSTRRKELPGRLGVVASALIDQEHGEVRVKDPSGNELMVHARIESGRQPVQGEQVILLEYDAQGGLYTVALFEEHETSNERKERS
jgi:hypothetical protein